MVTRIRQGNARPLLALFALLAYLALPGLGVGTVESAFAQAADDLARAREHYEFAEFDQALAILDGMIARGGLTDERRLDAHVLQARCHVGLGNARLAAEAFCSALAIDPDWRPDPVFFPRSELDAFEAARDRCPEEEPAPTPVPVVTPVAGDEGESTAWYKKPIVWLGAAAAVVVAVVVAGGGDDDDGGSSLPDPPQPPESSR